MITNKTFATMETTTYKLFDAINREGISNMVWGLCEDIDSTKDYFETVEDIELQGQFVYVYREADESFCFIKESTCGKPLHTLSVAKNEFIDIYKL